MEKKIKTSAMRQISLMLCFTLLISGCQNYQARKPDRSILLSMGEKHRKLFVDQANYFRNQIAIDSTQPSNYLGLAESNIVSYAFGLLSRAQTIPEAEKALQKAFSYGSNSSKAYEIKGILDLMHKRWNESEESFKRALELDLNNLSARHWYTLFLMLLEREEEGMEQSDMVARMDQNGDFLIARSSIFYFKKQFEKMKTLLFEAIEKNPSVPWNYDWLGMAYNGLKEHDDALDAYFKAFELSDGTVEVGGGLGHALGDAGEYELAKEMADLYTSLAKENYLPPCQRAFIHISIKEYDKALTLLEQAFEEESWFLLFMQIEHWYDPIRGDKRFQEILRKMNFPKQ